jgi:hypothetical protein
MFVNTPPPPTHTRTSSSACLASDLPIEATPLRERDADEPDLLLVPPRRPPSLLAPSSSSCASSSSSLSLLELRERGSERVLSPHVVYVGFRLGFRV